MILELSHPPFPPPFHSFIPMDAIARRVAAGLRDPLAPTFCVSCLGQLANFCVDDKTDAVKEGNPPTLLEHYLLLTRIMLFLTTPRKHDGLSLSRYQDRLVRSTRTCSARASHPRDLTPISDFIGLYAIKLLYYVVWPCLDASPAIAARKFRRRGLWPRSIDELLPRGPSDSLQALVDWLDSPASSVAHIMAVQLLTGSLKLCHREIMTQALHASSPLRQIFIDEIICGQLRSAISSARSKPDDTFTWSWISAYTSLLRESWYGADLCTFEWVRFISGSVDKVLRAFRAALLFFIGHIASQPESSRSKEIAQAADSLFASLQADIIMASGGSLSARERARDGYTDFARSVLNVTSRSGCCMLECNRHRSELPKKLQRCASCSVFRYCSRDCQKGHWVLHKAVCLLLRAVLKDAHGDAADKLLNQQEEFIAACRASSIEEEYFRAVSGHIGATVLQIAHT